MRPMGLVCSCINPDKNTKATGEETYLMGKARKLGLMVACMKENIFKEVNVGMVGMSGLMTMYMKEIGRITSSKVRAG